MPLPSAALTVVQERELEELKGQLASLQRSGSAADAAWQHEAAEFDHYRETAEQLAEIKKTLGTFEAFSTIPIGRPLHKYPIPTYYPSLLVSTCHIHILPSSALPSLTYVSAMLAQWQQRGRGLQP